MLPTKPRRRAALIERTRIAERMDEPDLSPAALDRALAAIARINELTFTARQLWKRAQRLMRQRNLQQLHILELGCGDANVSLGIARRAQRAGARIDVTACDVSPVAVARARQLANRHNVSGFRAFVADATRDDLGGPYDVVISSLFMHHLDESDAVTLLRRLPRLCRLEAWMDDLSRSRLGYWLAYGGCRVITRSPVVRFDGPASVRSAWTPDEALKLAQRAGLNAAWVERRWPERYILGWSRPATEAEAA